MEIILHIGLCKTGSSFLQSEIFTALDNGTFFEKNNIIYNPDEIFLQLLRVKQELDMEGAVNLRNHIENNFNDKTILISYEGLSISTQHMYDWAKNDFQAGFEILRTVFPKAKIIVFLRYQPDLVCSEYKELAKSLVFDNPDPPDSLIGSPIDELLIYVDGEFQIEARDDTALVNVHFAYSDLVEMYAAQYGSENVNVFFFEDLCSNPQNVLLKIYDVLGVKNLKEIESKKVNSAYSVATIFLISIFERIRNSRLNNIRHGIINNVPAMRASYTDQRQTMPAYKLMLIFLFKAILFKWFTRKHLRDLLNFIDPMTHGFIPKRQDSKDIYTMKRLLEKLYVDDNLKLKKLVSNLPAVYLKAPDGR